MSGLDTGSAARRWLRGFSYPFRGLAYLARHPALWRHVAVPVLITVGLMAGAAFATLRFTPRLLASLWAMPAAGAAVALWVAAAVLLGLLIFALSTVALYFVSGLIAVPFNDWLSQQVETQELGPREEPFSWPVFLGDLRQSIAHSLLSLLMWAAVMGPLFLLELLPGIGSVLHFALGTLATAFFLAREMMDGVMSRRRFRFVYKLQVVRGHLALTQGFGAATALLLWIPLLNFLSLPAAVIGGTLMFCELERERLLPPGLVKSR